MKKIYIWFNSLSKRLRDSISTSILVVGFVSTVFTILGFSLADIKCLKLWGRILVVIAVFFIVIIVVYKVIGRVFKERVNLIVNQTPVDITCGDIFETEGWKVIGCDTSFRTQVDDVVISKNSLHGKLVLQHGNAEEINDIVESAAQKYNISKNENGLFEFPLGTIIPYTSSKDGETYLMLAMTELNKDFESHTNMAKYESMLMKMWHEVSRVYASHDVVFPILGAGISRFDDGPKNKNTLLRCMLCTLGSSGLDFNSRIKVVIYGKAEDIPLYELRDVVKTRR